MADESKWWGWGRADRRVELPESAVGTLRERLGLRPEDGLPPVELDAVRLPEPRAVPAPVARAAGAEGLLTGSEDRVRHAAGRGYPDMIRLRRGELDAAPDAVAVPADAGAVEALLGACTRAGVAVVPYGGGTSVVGGIEPLRGDHAAVISLDLGRLRAVEVDRTSLTARLGPGLRGPEAEAVLAADGVTLGHFPQSFEQATIGGFAATRSAGQASSGYGRFDDLVTAIELVAPAGRLGTVETPHSAAGPSLRELVVGSEGTLGVIAEVTCRVRPKPEERRYEGWIAEDFQAGMNAFRELAQSGDAPDVLRLSDEDETWVSLQMSGTEGLARRALDAYLALRRRRGGCLVICGWEGTREAVRRRRTLAARRLRAYGVVSLGTRPGRSWDRGRNDAGYVRDELLGLGVLAETLETGHTWSRLPELYASVRKALQGALGPHSLVFCHISHVYPDGASLYFTLLARARRGQEIEQWKEAKQAASEAIVGCGGTISHHHAVGRDHAPYMAAEIGSLGIEALRAIKDRLDPNAIMNPGKLLPS